MRMLLPKQKKSQTGKGNRLLISITVIGSAGPIRFVVNEEDIVSGVIVTALKTYAREGRLPILGSDINNFLLYCSLAGTDALNPSMTIGSIGVRNFMLCKKPQTEKTNTDEQQKHEVSSSSSRKGNGSWKAWLNKSLNLKVSSH
ncbi:uncharacterized protein At4g22758-like [Impatiens glandulifera]|uniref:uncharacterized protein At4g22758-like n=1 Tax=Impatiens glandulifera TaxID=253017 RepID=UPI001FB17B16|nr:uncharacterized protein At4g22758-like [Impatiens glandulifera]